MRHTTTPYHTCRRQRHAGILRLAASNTIKTYLLIFLITYPLHTFASAHTLIGHIATPDGTPLSGCSVILYAAGNDTIPVTGTGSNTSGNYTLQAPTGQYKLRASYIGKTTTWQHIDLTADTAIDTIYMATDPCCTQEVTITACCINYRNDGNIVVNIPGNPFAQNTTPFDMLYKIPGTWGLTIYGKEITRLYINDIEQHIPHDKMAALLKSIDIDLVESIEIIPTDTRNRNMGEGALHITLREPHNNGLYLSAGYTPSVDFGTAFSHDITLNLAARYQKLLSFTTFELSENPIGSSSLHRDLSYNYHNATTRQSSSDSERWDNNILITQSLIYEIDSANSLYANFNAQLQPHEKKWEESKEQFNNTAILYPDSTRTDWLQTQHNYSAYAAYRHLFDRKGSQIEASLHYFRYDHTRRGEQQLFYPDHSHNFAYRNDNKSDAISPAIDASIHLPHNLMLHTGLQYIYTLKNNNHTQQETAIPYYSDPIHSSEHLTTLDANLSGQYGRLHFTAALTLQYIHGNYHYGIRNTPFTYSDFIIAPLAQLQFEENRQKGHVTTLTFTTTPTIPMPAMLNPGIRKRGQYTYFTGNSDLRTSYNYTLQLRQQLFGNLTVSLDATWRPHFLDNTITIGDDRRSVIYSYRNHPYAARYAATLYYNRHLFPFWHINAEATLAYDYYRAHTIGTTRHLSGNIQLANSFNWGNGWTATLLANYRSSQRTPYILYGSGYAISATIGKNFFNNRLTLLLEATDFITDLTDSSTTYLNHYTLQEINDDYLRCFGLSIIYRFGIGNKDIKAHKVTGGNAHLRAM